MYLREPIILRQAVRLRNAPRDRLSRLRIASCRREERRSGGRDKGRCPLPDRRRHGNLHTAAVWGVLERVSEHVGKHDTEPRGVSLDDCLVASSNKIKANIMLREPRQKLVGEVPRQAQEIDPVEVEPELARLDSREVE